MQTTIFVNGQSQAIRIPKDYKLKGHVCEITKKGNALIIREKRPISWSRFFLNKEGAKEI
jgi:virulence-associated protein VagC